MRQSGAFRALGQTRFLAVVEKPQPVSRSKPSHAGKLRMPSSYPIGLPYLLGIPTLDDFFDKLWEREPRIVHRSIEDSLPDILTLDQFETLLASAPSGAITGLSIVEGGMARPVSCNQDTPTRLSLVYDAYCMGHTLLLSGLQLWWPKIATLCREIENQVIAHGIVPAEEVRANAYATPAGSQGFDIHYDNHCAFILQMYGSKRWTVFPPTEPLPLARCERPLLRNQLGDPILETELAAGDVLYIPRGFPHFAHTMQESSLHLTLSLRTMTWSDVVSAVCQSNATFRRSVALSISTSFAQDYFERELAPQFLRMDVGSFLKQRQSESFTRLIPKPHSRLRAIDDGVHIGAETPILRVPQVHCTVSEENGETALRFPGACLRLPAAMKPVFDFIAQRKEEFTAGDLPSIDATYDAVELVRILIRRGLVYPITNRDAEGHALAGGVLVEGL